MTKLCGELDDYVSGLRRSDKAPMVAPTIVRAFGTAPINRGAKSHEQPLHHRCRYPCDRYAGPVYQPRARSMRDRRPRIETEADGTQRWVMGKSKGLVLGSDNRDVLETQGITTGGLGSFKNPPKSIQEMHTGAYDPKARSSTG